ncbi:hypothetical protein FA95DRAFT_1556080 [Auriscalpium vulgare]|uniref:Uncharacterized protein n=1 Tax=Auriscalpium vulgare TaxID=40419 RepID=A0ACB8S208_9AGAM|nr:hypothetical protein FA95DRAFT_1556080 [Auriscalpium vulgare]
MLTRFHKADRAVLAPVDEPERKRYTARAGRDLQQLRPGGRAAQAGVPAVDPALDRPASQRLVCT